MTTFTAIPNASLEPGKPIRSIDGLALRDNPIAMFEGDASAPKLADAALSTTATNNGRDWILARTALALAGAVGTYAFAKASSNVAFGSTIAGSSLQPTAGAYGVTKGSGSSDTATFALGATLSGTWRAMGTQTGSAASGTGDPTIYGATLWLRIS